MNEAFVYMRRNGQNTFLGLFSVDGIEEEVRHKSEAINALETGTRFYFIFRDQQYALNI